MEIGICFFEFGSRFIYKHYITVINNSNRNRRDGDKRGSSALSLSRLMLIELIEAALCRVNTVCVCVHVYVYVRERKYKEERERYVYAL